MHNIKPRQTIIIKTIEIAVAADKDEWIIADKISSLLSENGVCSDDGVILDWQYVGDDREVVSPDDVAEGGIFATYEVSHV